MGGDTGVSGRGFSLLRLLVLLACLNFRGDRGDSLPAEGSSGEAVVARSPVCIFVGLCLPPEIDPSLRMPFRTPARKSPFSASSSVAESDGVENFDSSESARREVSLSDMANHAEEARERIYQHLKALPAPRLHILSLIVERETEAYLGKVGPNSHYLCFEPLSVMMFGWISWK